MHAPAVVALLLLTACVSNGYMANSMMDNRPRVLVANDGLETVAVYDPYGRIGTVMPGQKGCFQLTNVFEGASTLTLKAVTGNDVAVTPQFNPSDSDGWSVKIDAMPLKFAANTLQPAEPCAFR